MVVDNNVAAQAAPAPPWKAVLEEWDSLFPPLAHCLRDDMYQSPPAEPRYPFYNQVVDALLGVIKPMGTLQNHELAGLQPLVLKSIEILRLEPCPCACFIVPFLESWWRSCGFIDAARFRRLQEARLFVGINHPKMAALLNEVGRGLCRNVCLCYVYCFDAFPFLVQLVQSVVSYLQRLQAGAITLEEIEAVDVSELKSCCDFVVFCGGPAFLQNMRPEVAVSTWRNHVQKLRVIGIVMFISEFLVSRIFFLTWKHSVALKSQTQQIYANRFEQFHGSQRQLKFRSS